MTANGVKEAEVEKTEILGNLSDEKLQEQISKLKKGVTKLKIRDKINEKSGSF